MNAFLFFVVLYRNLAIVHLHEFLEVMMEELGTVLNPAELGRYLMQVRDRADMKQADLARRVSLSPAVLSRIESGDRAVTRDEVIDILTQIPSTEAAQLIEALKRDWRVLPMPQLDHEDQLALWAAEQVACELENLRRQPDVPQAFGRRVSEYVDELKRCAGLLLKREHQVAFIGAIGVGKSTAICHMTGLVVRKEDGTVAPVLADGGGGTTICEVHLWSGPQYGLSIESRNNDEIREDVRDFGDHVLRGTVPADEPGKPGESQGVSKEVARAIRNMADLGIKQAKDGSGKKIDPAKALAQTFPTSREFVVEVLSRMSLHTRDRRQVWYDPSSGKAPLTWLRDEFRRINHGLHPEFTLPKRIDVIVQDPLLKTDGLTVRVIDTKGIDRTAAREDLEIHLKDPHTLAVICSKFNDAPGAYAQQLLDRATEAGVRGLEVNASVLVLPQNREAVAMTDDATGVPVETVDEGYELKRDHAEMNMASLGLKDFRIGFYNCFGDQPQVARDFVAAGLHRARERFRSQLEAAAKGARDLLSNHKEEANRAVLEDAAGRLRVWLKMNSGVPVIPGNIQESLLGEIMAVHPSAVHAAARRDGEWDNLSYSYQIGFGARRLAVAALGKRVDGFTEYCRVLNATPELEIANELIGQTERVLLAGFDDMQRKVQLMAQTVYRDALKASTELWLRCVEEWGLGRGYRQQVAGYSREWFNDEARATLEVELKALIEREWARTLNGVAELLGVEA
jgi:transcriptional regulator with XRE-family HTH domain